MPYEGIHEDTTVQNGLYGPHMIATSDSQGVVSLGGRYFGCHNGMWIPCGAGSTWYGNENVAYRLDCPSMQNCTWTELPKLATKRSYMSGVAVSKFKIANCEP